jgi:hypothetical protein
MRLPGFQKSQIRKSVWERIRFWKSIRNKPQQELNALILLKVLNAIVKAVYRAQEMTRVWIVADSETALVNYAAYSAKAQLACEFVESIVRSFGYKAYHLLEFEKDDAGQVITSENGHIIFSVCIIVEDLQEMSMDTVSSVRAQWSELNAKLPVEIKRKAYKKKGK